MNRIIRFRPDDIRKGKRQQMDAAGKKGMVPVSFGSKTLAIRRRFSVAAGIGKSGMDVSGDGLFMLSPWFFV